MRTRSAIGAVMALAALVSLPAASEAHCLGFKHVRSGVVDVFDGTTTFVKRVTYRTAKWGDHMFGWLRCDKHI
ncbi:MAG: hypothetical protein ABUL43_01420 [Hyphomicrobium sp.]